MMQPTDTTSWPVFQGTRAELQPLVNTLHSLGYTQACLVPGPYGNWLIQVGQLRWDYRGCRWEGEDSYLDFILEQLEGVR